MERSMSSRRIFNPEGSFSQNVPRASGKTEAQLQFESFFPTYGPRIVFFVLWVGIQFALFFTAYTFYSTTSTYLGTRTLFGPTLAIAKGSAQVLNFNCGILLITVCRNIITYLRTTILNNVLPLDKNISLHKIIAWTILLFTLLHVGAHYVNFLMFDKALVGLNGAAIVTGAHFPIGTTSYVAYWETLAGTTGHFMVIIMLVMFAAAMEAIRRKSFEVFWYTHQLFVVFFILLLFHGAGCLIHADNITPSLATCPPTFWKWFIPAGFLYVVDRFIRIVRSSFKTYISKVVQHPSKVVEVQMKKPSMRYVPGNYLFLNCPEISRFEWHPFTISSAPEEDFVSCHIRVVGDWTTAFAKRLGCVLDKDQTFSLPNVLPRVRIDGPFGSSSSDVFKYEIAVCIGAGIGVTPFSSVLKSIWYRVINPTTVMKLRKVYFIWICRDTEAFEWFSDLLESLEAEDIDNFLDISIYITGGLKAAQINNVIVNDSQGADALTGLRSPTKFGRPNFDQLFYQMSQDNPSTDIGVFFCGPKVLSTQLHRCANRQSSTRAGGTKFFFHKENF